MGVRGVMLMLKKYLINPIENGFSLLGFWGVKIDVFLSTLLEKIKGL